MLRDQALALGGLLVERVGGPPVRPYQPPGIWEDFSFNQIRYAQDNGERALSPQPVHVLAALDRPAEHVRRSAAAGVHGARQSRTNTPLHALVMLNDVTYVEAARVWAEKLLSRDDLSDDVRLDLAFRQATGRRARTRNARCWPPR